MMGCYPTDFELHLFHEGNLYKSHHLFGAHVIKDENETYTQFCVWAPTAEKVGLAGDFNNWDGSSYPMEKINKEGVWFISLPGDLSNTLYKYDILSSTGERLLKADPFAFYSELRPRTASIVYPLEGYKWNDQKWLKKRNRSYTDPLAIYEVHAGSWKKKEDGSFLTYRELAEDLIPYVKSQGYSHIELLPLTEHPLDISWGYQTIGYYSITSRYGTPEDFMFFVDQCHQNGIGVILDWIPGHFCKDSHGLYRFDGSYAYDYSYEPDRENYEWGTANFDLGKTEVNSFLISCALFWMEKYHIDGFRVDAVANIIYWPNTANKENPFGINFLRKLNKAIADEDASVMMIAEDSTDWPKVTAPVEDGGLGFTYKWNMGWMNDMLKYMEEAPYHRSHLHNKVTFSLMYAFSEKFILPFSHDEVVHGKKSLLNKMPGEYWEKFAQLRLLLGYMYSHPGKKLTFMGTELGQFSEWKFKEQVDWNLFDYEMHEKINKFVIELNKLYKRSKPLYELDDSPDGFEWIEANNYHQSVFSFLRKGINPEEALVIVCNFTGVSYSDYRIGVPQSGTYKETFNSDSEDFGGSGFVNKKAIKAEPVSFHGKPDSVTMNISPFGFSILRPVRQRKGSENNEKETVRSDASGRRKGK